MSLFHGLSAFPITPTDENGIVDTDALARLVERLVQAKVDSIGLLGSTGGYAYLSPAERGRAVRAALAVAGNSTPVIVSVGALRTDQACQLAQDAEKAGAHGLLLAPMSYTPLTQAEAYQHFKTVSEATSLPLCIYNNPSTTHFSFGDDLLKNLSQLPNITAVKMPLPASDERQTAVTTMRKLVPDDFALGYSGDWGCADCLLCGADTWYSVVGGLFPVQTLQLANAAKGGDQDEVARINGYFQPLWDVFQEFGSYRVIYTAANHLELTRAKPHLPVLPLVDGDMERVILAVEKLESLT